MKSIVLALGASLCLASSAFAQAPTSPPPAATPATAPAVASAPAVAPTASTTPAMGAPELGKDGKPKVKAIREACRADATGLKGEAKQKAIMDCVVKQRPDLAGREQCRMDGRAKGLRKDELKAFVKDCAKGKA